MKMIRPFVLAILHRPPTHVVPVKERPRKTSAISAKGVPLATRQASDQAVVAEAICHRAQKTSILGTTGDTHRNGPLDDRRSDHNIQPTHSSTTGLKSFAKLVLAPFVVIHDLAIEAAARLVRRGSLVRKHLRGDDPLCDSGKAAVYVHFDSKGAIHDYIIHQLRELMDAGFRITFVSNAPIFPESSRALVRPFCKDIIWRFNTGYDFGAYKDGIASLGNLDQIDTLALMNDSIYGPFWKLSETLSAIDKSKYDFWGIVDSWEQQRYHLQTFFIVFFAKALRSSAFKTFWRTYPYVNNKGWVILMQHTTPNTPPPTPPNTPPPPPPPPPPAPPPPEPRSTLRVSRRSPNGRSSSRRTLHMMSR